MSVIERFHSTRLLKGRAERSRDKSGHDNEQTDLDLHIIYIVPDVAWFKVHCARTVL